MKRTKLVFTLASISLLLASCSSPMQHSYDEYCMNIGVDTLEGFKIMQINDLHFGIYTNLERQFRYLDKLIDANPCNFIVLDGDVFTEASKMDVKQTFDYFESKQIPWTLVYGNHDKQGFYKSNYLPDELNKIHEKEGSFLYYYNIKNDNVYGDSNFIVNLNNNLTGKTLFQLYLIDSNTYNYSGLVYDYDVIHEDQIEWYKRSVLEAKSRNDDQVVPSFCFFHVPLYEFIDAVKEKGYEYPNFDNEDGFMNEKCCVGYKNTGFFDAAKELGSTKAIFVAHDHVNTFVLDYQGIKLSYGVKTGDCLYHIEGKIGAQFITLNADASFQIEQVYETYEGIDL